MQNRLILLVGDCQWQVIRKIQCDQFHFNISVKLLLKFSISVHWPHSGSYQSNKTRRLLYSILGLFWVGWFLHWPHWTELIFSPYHYVHLRGEKKTGCSFYSHQYNWGCMCTYQKRFDLCPNRLHRHKKIGYLHCQSACTYFNCIHWMSEINVTASFIMQTNTKEAWSERFNTQKKSVFIASTEYPLHSSVGDLESLFLSRVSIVTTVSPIRSIPSSHCSILRAQNNIAPHQHLGANAWCFSSIVGIR